MATAKDELRNILNEQPDDSSTEELVRELSFHVMVKRGFTEAKVDTFGDHPSGLGKITRTLFARELRRTLYTADSATGN